MYATVLVSSAPLNTGCDTPPAGVYPCALTDMLPPGVYEPLNVVAAPLAEVTTATLAVEIVKVVPETEYVSLGILTVATDTLGVPFVLIVAAVPVNEPLCVKVAAVPLKVGFDTVPLGVPFAAQDG